MFEKLKNKFNAMKEEDERLNQLLKTTTPTQGLYQITVTNNDELEHKQKFITYNCPDINDEKAKAIVKLIPVEETLLEAYYAKEILTQKEYFIIPTNYRLWIINMTSYKIYSLTESTISIVKNNLMSKVILLNNTLFEVNGSNEKITKLINILTNQEERSKIIIQETAYLCGIYPTYQKINSIKSGISIDKDNNTVLHTKDKNIKCLITDITNYELLLDTQTLYSKESYKRTSLGTAKNSCYQMNLRITLNNNEQITLPILETSGFNTKYESTGSTYQTNLNFAMEIINKIRDLTEPKY